MKTSTPSVYMNGRDILDYCRVSASTIKRWRASGLPFRKIGDKILYRMDEVDRFIEKHKI